MQHVSFVKDGQDSSLSLLMLLILNRHYSRALTDFPHRGNASVVIFNWFERMYFQIVALCCIPPVYALLQLDGNTFDNPPPITGDWVSQAS